MKYVNFTLYGLITNCVVCCYSSIYCWQVSQPTYLIAMMNRTSDDDDMIQELTFVYDTNLQNT